MTRGRGLYDDEDGSAAQQSGENEKDPDRDTPDVEKDTGEPTG
jgi:hypothetical protein